jgi:hypothetical protein
MPLYSQTEAGEWLEDPDQEARLKCDFIISAFGSGLYDTEVGNFLQLLTPRSRTYDSAGSP